VRPAKDLLTLESVSIGKAGKMQAFGLARKRSDLMKKAGKQDGFS
jgi:hypothetical protein